MFLTCMAFSTQCSFKYSAQQLNVSCKLGSHKQANKANESQTFVATNLLINKIFKALRGMHMKQKLTAVEETETLCLYLFYGLNTICTCIWVKKLGTHIFFSASLRNTILLGARMVTQWLRTLIVLAKKPN